MDEDEPYPLDSAPGYAGEDEQLRVDDPEECFDLLRIESHRAWLITSNSKSSRLSVESSDRESDSSGISS